MEATRGEAPARSGERRKADALAALTRPAADVWVATASPEGRPHLVPLSLAWLGDAAVIAVEGTSVTARNLASSGAARLAVGPTRDVVMLDVELERTVDVAEDAEDAGHPGLGAAYADQADWDPRASRGYVFMVLRPVRVQAWREVDEMAGRTLMRDGRWLV